MSGLGLVVASVFLLVGAVLAGDDSNSNSASQDTSLKHPAYSAHTSMSTSGPPLAEKRPLVESLHGVKITDNYRWLEDGSSPDTQKWVAEEMAYTQKVLNPLPGRDAIHKRLTELLSIGSISAPMIGGKYYFYTRRDGMQNQPVLYVRERGISEWDD